MTENKRRILALLLPTLQATDYFSDLVDLVYGYDQAKGIEYVVAFFLNGSQKMANVTADSGIAMIRDILKQIT